MPTDSDTIWKALKTSLLKTTKEVGGWTKRKKFCKLAGGVIVSIKLEVRKSIFGKLGSWEKLPKRNTYLLREHLNMLSVLQKVSRGKEVWVYQRA